MPGARTLLLVALVAIVACAPASNVSRGQVAGGLTRETPLTQPLMQPGDRADGLPSEAFEQLVKSTSDSCSACARDARRRAFRVLEERFPPGAIVWSDSLDRFRRAPGSANQLVRASDSTEDPMLRFRFHTAADHLVGIAASDLTEEIFADRYRSAPRDAVFRGAIEIIPFAYGDGATFLYHAPDNTIEVQCRILELAVE